MPNDNAAPDPGSSQSGHGRTATLRRQSAWVAYDREGHRTGLFEVICPGCGDHPELDYSEVPPWLQRLRGPHPLKEGLAAHLEHLGG